MHLTEHTLITIYIQDFVSDIFVWGCESLCFQISPDESKVTDLRRRDDAHWMKVEIVINSFPLRASILQYVLPYAAAANCANT